VSGWGSDEGDGMESGLVWIELVGDVGVDGGVGVGSLEGVCGVASVTVRSGLILGRRSGQDGLLGCWSPN
jgi:hypothetical protein